MMVKFRISVARVTKIIELQLQQKLPDEVTEKSENDVAYSRQTTIVKRK